MSNLIPLPRHYGPKPRPKRGRPPKNQPRATVHYLQPSRVSKLAERIAVQSASDPKATAYSLYCDASKLDETDPASAIPLYEQSINLDPRLSIAYVNLGNCYFRRHDHVKAQSLYEQALAIDPSNPEGLYNLGYLYLERGGPDNLEKALHYLSASLQADPSFPDAHFNYAMALEQAGNILRAQYHWRRYVKLAPGDSNWVEIARRHLA